MKITIDFDKEIIIKKLEKWTRQLVLFLYGWLSNDGEALGNILGFLHIMMTAFCVSLILISHTIYPFISLKLASFILLFIVWFQHLILNVCIVTVAEESFIKGGSAYHEIIYRFIQKFNITIPEFVKYLFAFETGSVCCLFLELVSQSILYVFHRTSKTF